MSPDPFVQPNHANEIDTDEDHGNGPGASITATTGLNWDDPLQDAVGNMTKIRVPGTAYLTPKERQ